MHTFRVTSQTTYRGGKAMGGLRGSSKIGTSNANKRAQSRRAYGENFFFSMNPAATGHQLQDGSYFLAYRGSSASSSSSSDSIQPVLPQPAALLIFSTSSDGVQTLLMKPGDGIAVNQLLTWNSLSQRYEMSANDNDPYGIISFYQFDYSPSINTYDAKDFAGYAGTVYSIPSGPDLLDSFYLYTLDEFNNKTFIYTYHDRTSGMQEAGSNKSFLVDGVPTDENSGDPMFDSYRLDPLTYLYTKYLYYPNSPYNPVKYFKLVDYDGYLDFSAEQYVTVHHQVAGFNFEDYVAPTPSTLDPNASSTVNQGARAPYDELAFECNLVPPTLSTEDLVMGAKVYKLHIEYDILPNGPNGNYLITWYDNIEPRPQLINAQDTSNNPEISYQIGNDSYSLSWDVNDKKYSAGTVDELTNDSINFMKFSVMPDNNNGTTYLVQSNNGGKGVVVPLPSGPSLDEIFTLYTTDSSDNKQYVYFNNTVSTGISNLVLGEPDPTVANASDYTIAEFKVMYDKNERFYPGTRIPLKYYSITNNTNSTSNYVYFSNVDGIITALVGYGELTLDIPTSELDPELASNGSRADYGTEVFSAYFVPPSLETSTAFLVAAAISKEKYVEPSTTIEGTNSDGYIMHRSGMIRDALSEEVLATIQTDEAGKYSTSILTSNLPEVVEVIFDGEGEDKVSGETHLTVMSALFTKEELEGKDFKGAHVTYMTTMHNELCKEVKDTVKASTSLTEEEKVAEMKELDTAMKLKMVECFGGSMESIKDDIIEVEDLVAIEASQKIHSTIESITSTVENSINMSSDSKVKITREKILKTMASKIKDTVGKLSLTSSTIVSNLITSLENSEAVVIPEKVNLSSFIASVNADIESVHNDTTKSFNEKVTEMVSKSKGYRDTLKEEVKKTDSKLKYGTSFTSSDFETMKSESVLTAPTNEDIKDSTAIHNVQDIDKIILLLTQFNANEILASSEFTSLQNGSQFPMTFYRTSIRALPENIQKEISVEVLKSKKYIVPATVLTPTSIMEKVNSLFSTEDMSQWSPFRVIEKTKKNCKVTVMGGSFTAPYYSFDLMQSKEPLAFDTRKTYTFKRQMISHPFFLKDLSTPSRIEITGQGTPTSGISNGQSLTLKFKENFDTLEDKITYFCTTHNEMNKEWSDQEMYFTSYMSNEYVILAKSSSGDSLSQWVLDMALGKMRRIGSYDDYWVQNGMEVWRSSSSDPVVEEIPVQEPISLKEKILIRWLELGMEGDIVEFIIPREIFTQDIYNSAYGSKRNDPIKIIAQVNNELVTFIHSDDKFIEFINKYESEKSKENWETAGDKLPNDSQVVSFSGVVNYVDLEGGYWTIVTDASILPGDSAQSSTLIVTNWEQHIDKQIEGTRVQGVAVVLRDRVSFMSGKHVYLKSLEFEVSTS